MSVCMSMSMSVCMSLRLLALCFSASLVRAAVKEYSLHVTYGFWSADCVNKQIFLTNGVYPAPTLYATEGDTLIVHLFNDVESEGLAVHWHGIRQYGTPYMDGSAYIAQCPINPGEVFTYKFTVDKAGTYMYHGHFGLQQASGLYGFLIVKDPPSKPFKYKYDAELNIILNDWWHRSIYDQMAGLDHVPFIWIGDPQSLLINGKGQYNCSLITPAAAGPLSGDSPACDSSNPQCAPEVFNVTKGLTYRVRLASIAQLSMLNFGIQGHKLRVVTADAYYVSPFTVDLLDIYSGQTFDILLTADQVVDNYWVFSGVRGRPGLPPRAQAILTYSGASGQAPSTPPPPTPAWNDTAYSVEQFNNFYSLGSTKTSPSDTPPVPQKASRRLILVGTQNGNTNGQLRWALNNITFVRPETPLYLAIKSGVKGTYDSVPPPDEPLRSWNYSLPLLPAYGETPYSISRSPFYALKLNSVIDVIIQNVNTLTPGNSEYHPWHLHGHHFWVLGHGFGKFDNVKDPATFNLRNPPYRFSVPTLPYGWTAIRFVADNPGVWSFHCHVVPHLYMGMAAQFLDGTAQTLPQLPQGFHKCGLLY
eukprot:TRINITY_DN7636_c0_g1_i1.p1 TRINITY_DN7636_c0_g1~~TRINITY_DN7636_c0_g1_i1.p1  ORF type:complete len:588 (-),score=92.40 TRINITY_DN7636_c0_g1_i1:257-2020(-)